MILKTEELRWYFKNRIPTLFLFKKGELNKMYFSNGKLCELECEMVRKPNINHIVVGIIKIGICIYAATLGITELLGLDDYKPFVLTIAAFTAYLSVWVYENLIEMVKWALEISPYYSIPFQIIIPFLILIISFMKQRRLRGKE